MSLPQQSNGWKGLCVTKYFAKKTACTNGHLHASKREAKRCDQLHLLQRGREIEGLTIEPKFEFMVNGKPLKMGNGRVASYRPDFTYMERGKLIAEDVKGFVVRDFPLRAALFRHLYPDWELRLT
jgi:hypothetical protein